MLLWTRLGPLTRVLAQRIQPVGPPILVIGMGRSGTSWVGEILGRAPDAMYLREPVTQSMLAAKQSQGVPFNPEADELCARWGDRAFAATPSFPANIQQHPNQWRLRDRRQRRLVIKEVDPLLLPEYLSRYRPRVVFLLRHPAGVALSASRLGLGPGYFRARILGKASLMQGPLRRWQAYLHSIEDEWEREGARQGAVLRIACDCLQAAPEKTICFYEDLCADPVEVFEQICAFCELRWTDETRELVERRSRGGDRSDPFGTSRDSASMAWAWRNELDGEALRSLRQGYGAFELPWYSGASEWELPSLPGHAERRPEPAGVPPQ